MSKLIALVFDDPYKAAEARAALYRMEGEGLLNIDETALVIKYNNGKVRLSQDINIVEKDQKIGHIIGLIAAAITGAMPLVLLGTVGGHLIGKLADNGITNKFIKEVSKELTSGTSSLILLGSSDTDRREKIIEKMKHWKPKILESDLPVEVEKEIDNRLHNRKTMAFP